MAQLKGESVKGNRGVYVGPDLTGYVQIVLF